MKIILCTYSKNEKYIDSCIKVLDELWIDHPEIIVFSDRGNFEHRQKAIGTSRGWVPMMAECLDESIKVGAIGVNEETVLLLEDHVPHRPVSGSLMLELGAFLRKNANTYLNLAGHGKGKLLARMSACSVHSLEFHAFSSLHPAIWSVVHLRAALDAALESGAHSPWQFEKSRIPDAVHYTTGEEVWHSPHGGFLWEGMVNRPALATMRSGTLIYLRRRLVSKFVAELPKRILKRIRNLTARRE